MQFFAAAFALVAAVTTVTGAPVESPFMGVINAPTASSILAAEQTFPFSYSVNNWCEEGYNTFQVFLTSGTAAPTYNDLDGSGNVPNALTNFGRFAVANFGLPPPSNPPPSNLTLPSLSSETIENVNTYLTVVEIFTSCPGRVPEEFGVTSVPFVYQSS